MALKHSTYFRMWCTCVQRIAPWSLGAAFTNACIRPEHSPQRTDGPDRLGIFPVRILSLPTPAFEKIVPLSHSVTLICHFL